MEDSALPPPAQQHKESTPAPNEVKVEAVAPPLDFSNNVQDVGPSSKDVATTAVQANEPKMSHSPAPTPNEESGLSDAVVYGTRSRNRNGNSRPNYAEDQDNMDFEMSIAPPAAKPSSGKGANSGDAKRGQHTATDPKRAANDQPSTRFIGVNGTERNEKSPSSGKDPIPGTSTFTTNPSKKRKAVANAGSNGTVAAAAAAAPAQPSTKRSAGSFPLTPPANTSRTTNMLTFEKSKAILKKGSLVADDGTILNINDHVYLVCEPPGDPYYLCRIMEFCHAKSDDPKSPIDSIRVNWFYRPRDVLRHNSDTRLVYSTMHSDICPLTSLRGKCQILHRSEISNLDEYRKGKDCFWFSQLFDRFIRRFYEVIPTKDIINVPDKVKKALDERWKYIAVEVGRVKELTSAVKLCKRCSQYCASQDSVDCAICHNSYHMNCVNPPLPKKPTRGFAWACGPCSRAQEKRLEARHTPVLGQSSSATEEEVPEEEEEEEAPQPASTRDPSPSEVAELLDQHPGTQAEIAMAKMWPFRYLGIHCRVEDALQYDDRAIYPRASSRLGPRHQANVTLWHGRPVELVKPADIKKRYVKNNSHKKDGKLSKETLAAIEADRVERAKRPKWVQDEPTGYVHRGEDFPNDDPRCTAQLLWDMPGASDAPFKDQKDQEYSTAASEAFIDRYMERVKAMAPSVRVREFSQNYLDMALKLLMDNKYDAEKALQQLSKIDRAKDLKEPILNAEDLKKFEEGVSKYGSEHRLVRLHMKTTLPHSTIVRFYYLWKKTPPGRQIWDHYGGRKGKKRNNMDAGAKLQAEVADAADDSAFDNDKAAGHKRGFKCKFCSTTHSRQWRRAPGVTAGQSVPGEGKSNKDKTNRLLLALCGRCAGLWRRYAIQWEELDEVTKKAVQNGGRSSKKRIDEELLREILADHEVTSIGTPDGSSTAVPSIEGSVEPPKKKTKTGAEEKKKEKPLPPPKEPTPPPPPIVPEQPRWRELPCAVCKAANVAGEKPISCSHCKLSVHKRCYGLSDTAISAKWICDTCSNDRNAVVSTIYQCVLCPVEETQQELLEPPRVSHKKKTDREREKERLEKELVEQAKKDYITRQNELRRPVMPREPLKKTDGNNWIHIQCAVWTPEIRFSDATRLEKSEGITTIPSERGQATCKICKKNNHGFCASCLQCKANFHVGCAANAGYTLGFDVTPIKGSRKDHITTATLGAETGAITAAIWCKEHAVKTPYHTISEMVDDQGPNALQIYVEHYKQADRTLTGTARKANLLSLTAKLPPQLHSTPSMSNRRVSTASSMARGTRQSSAGLSRGDDTRETTPTSENHDEASRRKCVTCGIDVSPKWWVAERTASDDQAHHVGNGPDVAMSSMPAPPAPLAQVNGGTNGDDMSGRPSLSNAGTMSGSDNSQKWTCHKCHWKSIQEPTALLPSEPPRSPTPPPQYPVQASWNAPPTTTHAPQLPPAQQMVRSPLEHPMTVPTVPAVPQPGPVYHAPPFSQPNGYPPPPPPLHAPPNTVSYGRPSPQAPAQSYGPPSSHAHVNHQPGLALGHVPASSPHLSNGVHSPHYPPLRSPTYLSASSMQQPPPRVSESPFSLPPQAAMVNGGHVSPPGSFIRPTTPPRERSADARPPNNSGNGASASPSVRNLLTL